MESGLQFNLTIAPVKYHDREREIERRALLDGPPVVGYAIDLPPSGES